MFQSDYYFDRELAMAWGQKALIAIAILVVTWLLARAAKWAFVKLVDRVPYLNRQTGTGESLGASLGKIVHLLIWLFGLIALLQVFALSGVITPLQTLLDTVMGFIPRLVGAGLIFFVGLIVARVVKQLVETSLATINFDSWVGRSGADQVTGTNKLGSVIGTIVFALIIIPVAIAALDTLAIESVSGPATQMLQMILTALPLIIGAGILLGIGYFIGNWASDLITSILPSLGVDRALNESGIVPAGTSASRVIGVIVMTAIMLFAGIAATRMLEFPELSLILDQILSLGGRVIFGSVVIAVGVMLANLISGLIARSTGESGGVVATMVKYLIIAVATFMGLTFMEIGEEIVVIAFTGFVFAVSVASALAFGLGGRASAAATLENMRARANAGTLIPPTRPAPAARAPAPRAPAARKPRV